jgi:tripartite-type tricarboxylate transporter receptor subunit TctC
MKRAIFVGVMASVVAVAVAVPGIAQGDYPARPAQIVVPFPPGGNTDILTRVLAEQYSAALKSPFTVVNKPGAGANIGAAFVANSDPDGYTLLMAPPATHAVNAYLYEKLPFDMETSFAPITMVARFPTCWWCIRPSASNRSSN